MPEKKEAVTLSKDHLELKDEQFWSISQRMKEEKSNCSLNEFPQDVHVEDIRESIQGVCGNCKGIRLPATSGEVRLMQFADDTTVISSSVASLKTSLQIINSFGSLSGLHLNKTKTKIMCIGSQKGSKDKIMGFKCITEPIKALGAFLSYDGDKNNEENFFSKICKMKTKLNIWQMRNLSLYGCSMLVKTVGASLLIYAASMLTVPEPVIQKMQAKLFAFLSRNKKDKIKRQIIYQPMSDRGLNFMNF